MASCFYIIDDRYVGAGASHPSKKPRAAEDPLADYQMGGAAVATNFDSVALSHPHEIFEPVCSPSDKPESLAAARAGPLLEE